MQTKANRRVPWVDSVKGVAMISVVLSHVVNGFSKAGMFAYSGGGGLLYTIQNITDIYQMPLFFLMSGFLFFFSYMTVNGELKHENVDRQILNFITLYVLWSFITWVIKIVFNSEVNTETKLWDILLIWCKPIGVYWYLYCLVVIYTLFRFDKIRNMPKKLMFTFMTLAGLAGSVFVNDYFGRFFCLRQNLYYLCLFYSGILLGKRIRKDGALKRAELIGILCCGFVAICLTVLFWDAEVEIYYIPIVNLITALGISFLVVLLFMSVDFLQKLRGLRYIGQHSIEIYVMHVFCTAGSRPIIRALGISNLYVCVLSVFLLSITIPLAVGLIAKRIGIYDLIFRPYFPIKHLIDRFRSDVSK